MPWLHRNEKDLYKYALAIQQLFKGRVNCTGEVTLRASQTTTVVESNIVTATDTIVLSPTTANAAGALATTYISAIGDGDFTITHASAVSTDRTFRYALFGRDYEP